jgi:hypothetical protein
MMQLPAGDEPPELRRRLEHALLMDMIQDPDKYLSPEAHQARIGYSFIGFTYRV